MLVCQMIFPFVGSSATKCKDPSPEKRSFPAVESNPEVPKPPVQTASADAVKHGAEVFNKFSCGDCHSPEADGAGAWILDGAIPDLRYMPADVHGQFLGIVLGGSHRENGMPGFAGEGAGFPLEHTIMTPEEANALHAYIIDLQWKAYNADQASLHASKATH